MLAFSEVQRHEMEAEVEWASRVNKRKAREAPMGIRERRDNPTNRKLTVKAAAYTR